MTGLVWAVAVTGSVVAQIGEDEGIVLTGGYSDEDGTLIIGTESPGTGTVVGVASRDDVLVGDGAEGVLDIESGGSFTVTNSLELGMGSTGTLNVHGGTLNVDGKLVIGANGTAHMNGGVLEANLVQVGDSATESQGGTFHLNAGTLLVGNVIAESPSHEGATNTFVWNGGTLQLKADQNQLFDGFDSPAAAVTIGTNGAFLDTNGFDATIGVSLGGSGDFHKLGGGTLTLTADQLHTGATYVEGGNLKLQNATLASGEVNLAEATTLYLAADGGNELLYTGNIAGEGAVVIQGHGNGKVVLSGEDTYTGATTIESGELEVRSDTALSEKSALTIHEGAQLTVYGDDSDSYLVEIGSLSGAGTVALGSGSGLIVGGDGSNTTFAGSIVSTGPATGIEKTGAGKLTLTGNGQLYILAFCGCYLNSEVEINGGNFQADLVENFGGTLSVVNGGQLEAGVVLSFGALRIMDDGSKVKAMMMSVVGPDYGLLEVGSGARLVTGSITVDGGKLLVNGVVEGWKAGEEAMISVADEGILAGSGIVGEVEIGDGGILSPGNSPGTLTASHTTWLSGGIYLWEINDAIGGGGTNWDLLNVNGTLSLEEITLDNPFTISIHSLGPDNNPGAAANFNPASFYSWTIATASDGIIGFDPAAFIIDTSAFVNLPGTDRFSITSDGNNLVLTYNAIPEPSVVGLGVMALLAGVVFMRRRGL